MFKKYLVLTALGLLLVGPGHSAALARSRKVCSTAATTKTARCHAIVLTDDSGVTPLTASAPRGYGPADFRSAYNVRLASATNVGIVVAYNAPSIQSDVNIYSKTFGLPSLPACTAASQTGCLLKLNEHGTTNYPVANSSWAVEASLDTEAVHALCPGCRITLVEANSGSISNLTAAVDTAVAAGAKIVSNSYGGPESSGEAANDSHYHKAGVIMVASSGDSGFGTNYPSASPYVVAVGGTSLKMSGSRVVSETAWPGAGSGCSPYEYKPTWQHDKACAMRSVADIAADADPATGAAVYDSFSSGGRSGWFTVGGTSLAAPLVAGAIAASGLSATQPAYIYTNALSVIRDISGGSNGSCSNYLCSAKSGYDGPTGLGVLNHL